MSRFTNVVLTYRYGTSTPASYVPEPESMCGRCEEHAPHAFIVVPAVEMEEWMCKGCIADLEAKGADHHEIVSVNDLARKAAHCPMVMPCISGAPTCTDCRSRA